MPQEIILWVLDKFGCHFGELSFGFWQNNSTWHLAIIGTIQAKCIGFLAISPEAYVFRAKSN